jgi:phage shock protein E
VYNKGIKYKGGAVMKYSIIVLLILIFIFMGYTQMQKKETDSYQQISMKEAEDLMKTETGYLILDVRTPKEFAQGHIPDAINVPNETIGKKEIRQLPDKDQKILVYCRSGNRSKQAAKKLVKLGYTDIIEFGGIIDWTGKTEK